MGKGLDLAKIIWGGFKDFEKCKIKFLFNILFDFGWKDNKVNLKLGFRGLSFF